MEVIFCELPYEMITLHFTLDYERFPSFDYALKKVNGQIIEQVFAEQIHLTVTLPVEKQCDLEAHFSPDITSCTNKKLDYYQY